jgi:hypothetical protein
MAELRAGHMQLKLVSHYGPKSREPSDFIESCQSEVSEGLPGIFRPYEMEQVHATLIGLEGWRSPGGLMNAQYATHGTTAIMNLKAALEDLSARKFLPVPVRFGGFRPDEVPFQSRGLTPYKRTFAIQDTNIVVAVGWPCVKLGEQENYGREIDGLRRHLNRFGILHKYYDPRTETDNDYFFVLGKVDGKRVSREAREALSEHVREQLAGLTPLRLQVSLKTVGVAAYTNEDLPLKTTCVLSIGEALNRLQDLELCYPGEPPN